MLKTMEYKISRSTDGVILGIEPIYEISTHTPLAGCDRNIKYISHNITPYLEDWTCFTKIIYHL